MRELNPNEIPLVAGGHDTQVCTEAAVNNEYYGVRDTSSVGQDLIDIYEGAVAATSHIIERVALALSD